MQLIPLGCCKRGHKNQSKIVCTFSSFFLLVVCNNCIGDIALFSKCVQLFIQLTAIPCTVLTTRALYMMMRLIHPSAFLATDFDFRGYWDVTHASCYLLLYKSNLFSITKGYCINHVTLLCPFVYFCRRQ